MMTSFVPLSSPHVFSSKLWLFSIVFPFSSSPMLKVTKFHVKGRDAKCLLMALSVLFSSLDSTFSQRLPWRGKVFSQKQLL